MISTYALTNQTNLSIYTFATLQMSVRGYVRTLHSVPYSLTVKEAVEWNYTLTWGGAGGRQTLIEP